MRSRSFAKLRVGGTLLMANPTLMKKAKVISIKPVQKRLFEMSLKLDVMILALVAVGKNIKNAVELPLKDLCRNRRRIFHEIFFAQRVF